MCSVKHFVTALLCLLCTGAFAQPGLELVGSNEPVSDPQRTFAAIVGVNKYKYVTPLNYAVEDAKWFADFLKSPAGGQVPAGNILLLTDSLAKSGNLLIELPQWLETRKLREGDRLYVFLSGHGDAENSELVYFLPADCNPAGSRYHYRQNGFNLQYLKSDLKTYSAKGVEVIFIMDACRTNELTPGVPSAGFIYKSLLDEKFGGVQMLSTNASSVSIEDSEYGGGHGLFTYYLMDGLIGEADRNADGYVSLRELQRHVEGAVEDAAMKKNKTQIPSFCCETANDKKIAKVHANMLAQYKKAKGEGKYNAEIFVMDRPGEKGVTAVADTLLTQLYARFSDALKEGRLTGAESATELYNTLAKADTSKILAENARFALLTEMVNFVQESINQYLDESKETLRSENNDEENLTQAFVAKKKRVAEASDSAVLQVATLADGLLPQKHNYKSILAEHISFLKTRLVLETNNTKELEKLLLTLLTSAQAPKPHILNTIGRIYNDLKKPALALQFYQKAVQAAPGWSVPVNNIGCVFYDVYQNFDSAYYYFRKALQLNPKSSMTLANIGQVYKKWNNYDSAYKYIAGAINLNRHEKAYYLQLANLYEKYNKYPQAITIYKELLAQNPTSPSAMNDLGWAYKSAGKRDSARIVFKNMAAITTWNGYTWRMIGKTFREQNNNDSAFYYYNRALAEADNDQKYWIYSDMGSACHLQEKYPESIKNYKLAIACNDTMADAYNSVAYSFSYMKQHDSALLYAKRAITLDPATGRRRIIVADIFYDLNKPDSSDAYLLKAEREFPSDPDVVRMVAEHYYLKRNDNAKAKNLYLKLTTFGMNDDGANGWLKLAEIYSEELNADSCIIAYRKVVEIWPDYSTGMYNMANKYLGKKQNDSAIYWYKKAVETSPGFIQAWVNTGAGFRNKQQYDSSLKYFKAALHIDSCFTFAHTNLCYSFYDMGMYDSAILYSHRLDACGTTYRGNYIRGISLNKQKRHDEAIAEFETSHSKKPDHAYTCYGLAKAYAFINDEAKALEWLEKAFKNGYTDKNELQEEVAFKDLQKTDGYKLLVGQYNLK